MTDFDELDELLSQSIELDMDNGKAPEQNFLTADLFSSMTDDEVITHFKPIRGIDYDRNYMDDYSPDVKKEKNEEEPVMYMADEFLPYRVLPQINPVYHLNQQIFKFVVPANRAKDRIDSPTADAAKSKENTRDNVDLIKDYLAELNNDNQMSQSNDESQSSDDNSLQNDNPATNQFEENSPVPGTNQQATAATNQTKDAMQEANKAEPRPVIKRKPRTYKYNPKPLQQKVNRAFVPDDLKDVEYWERRKRNNEAAKKSRKERREKELEIINNYENMQQEFETMRHENSSLKARNAVLENQINVLQKMN